MDYSFFWISTILYAIFDHAQVVKLADLPPPERGEGSQNAGNSIVRIWKVEMGEIKEIEAVGDIQLKSDNDYIIQTEPIIYYWLGKETPKGEVGEAASHAVLVAFKTSSKFRIQKEVEGRESVTFKTLFKADEASRPSTSGSRIQYGPDTERMFIIEEKTTNILTLREVVPSMYHLTGRKKICAVFDRSEKVYISCRKRRTEKQIKGAEELAAILMRRKNLFAFDYEYVHPNDHIFFSRYTEFITQEIPIANDEFTSAQMRRILGQTLIRKEDHSEGFIVVTYRLHEDHDGTINCDMVLKNHYHDENLYLEKLNDRDCYLADSESNAGLFLWIGRNSNLYVRKGAAKRAEVLLRQDPRYDYATPVLYVHQDCVPPGINSMRELMEHLNAQKESSEGE